MTHEKFPKATRAQARRALKLIPQLCGSGENGQHRCLHSEAIAEAFDLLLDKVKRLKPLPPQLVKELEERGTITEVVDAIVTGVHFGYGLALAQAEELDDDDDQRKAN